MRLFGILLQMEIVLILRSHSLRRSNDSEKLSIFFAHPPSKKVTLDGARLSVYNFQVAFPERLLQASHVPKLYLCSRNSVYDASDCGGNEATSVFGNAGFPILVHRFIGI